MADVAQLVRAPGCGSGGREFDSRRLPQLILPPFKMLDIVFFAVVAILIFYKLNSHLGKIDEQERESIINRAKSSCNNFANSCNTASTQPIQEIKLVGEGSTEANAKNLLLANLAEEEKNQLLEALKTSNTEFDIFIEEIKFSFAKIVESFAKGDLKSLKELTSGLIFNNFEQAIMLRQNSKKILNSRIIAIDKVDIIKVNKKDDDFSVSIKFATRQINFVMDENNKVIDGAESQIINLIDNWAFAKNIKLNNSAWKLVATN